MKYWIHAVCPVVLLSTLFLESEQRRTIELPRTEVEINEGKASSSAVAASPSCSHRVAAYTDAYPGYPHPRSSDVLHPAAESYREFCLHSSVADSSHDWRPCSNYTLFTLIPPVLHVQVPAFLPLTAVS